MMPAGMDMQHTTRPSRLAGFVLLSVLLHAPLLLHDTLPTISAPAPLAIVLENRGQPPVTVAPAASVTTAVTRTSTVPAPSVTTIQPEPALPPAALAAATTTAEAPAASATELSASAANASAEPATAARHAADIAIRINLALERHFHYPRLAQRRGWHGTVLLGFRVGTDGSIEAIHIAQSSGHALLDHAALGALGQVHKVALENGELRSALDLQLPVIYRLEES